MAATKVAKRQIGEGSSGGKLTYTETDVWAGTTAPSGAATKEYAWEKLSPNSLTLSIAITYAVAGTANTSVRLPIPASLPQPSTFGGLGGGAGHHVWPGYGWIDSGTNGGVPTCRVTVVRNLANTGWEVLITAASLSGQYAQATVTYYF